MALGINSGGAGNFSTTLSNLIPMATSWNGLQSGVSTTQSTYSPPAAKGFLPSIGDTIGSVGTDIAKGVGHAIVDAVTAPKNLGVGLYELGKAKIDGDTLNATIDKINEQSQNLNESLKEGRITLTQFNAGMKDVMKQYSEAQENRRKKTLC